MLHWKLHQARNKVLSLIAVCGFSFAAHAQVEVQGLKGDALRNVQAWLSIKKLDKHASERQLRRAHRKADEEIRLALRALGYYEPEILADLQLGPPWSARYSITPGPRLSFGPTQLDLGFAQTPLKLDKWLQTAELEGQPLRHDVYGQYKQDLLNHVFKLGYLDARYSERKLLVEPSKKLASIKLSLTPGVQYRFAPIHIEQDILNPDFLQKFVHIKAGQVFDADDLLALQLRLSDLDYFSDIQMNTERQANSQEVAVSIQTQPRKRERYQFGLGYGTDTGPRASALGEFRRLNRHGHKLRMHSRVSENENSASVEYRIPTGPQIGEHWAGVLRYSDELFGDTRSDEFLLGLSRQQLRRGGLWKYYVNFELERSDIADAGSQTRLLMPGISYTWQRSDNQLNPRRAQRWHVDIHSASRDLLSTASFVQVSGQVRWIQPFGEHSRLLFSAHGGATFLGDLSQLPASQRYFAGGDRSVRGYAYQSLSPEDGSGNLIGGEYLSVLSLEADRIFWKNMGFAVFADYGGASSQFAEDLKRGVGIGFRWRSPVGMLRVDIAQALDLTSASPRLHIGIGAEL